MDPEVRSKTPGKCPRCGMTLVANIPEPVEYPTKFSFTPPQIPANQNIRLEIRVSHPKTGAPVKHFQIVHEKLIHLFIVSEDLEYFAHVHPDLGPDGVFRLDTRLPKPGTYKLLADFFPGWRHATTHLRRHHDRRIQARASFSPSSNLRPTSRPNTARIWTWS